MPAAGLLPIRLHDIKIPWHLCLFNLPMDLLRPLLSDKETKLGWFVEKAKLDPIDLDHYQRVKTIHEALDVHAGQAWELAGPKARDW